MRDQTSTNKDSARSACRDSVGLLQAERRGMMRVAHRSSSEWRKEIYRSGRRSHANSLRGILRCAQDDCERQTQNKNKTTKEKKSTDPYKAKGRAPAKPKAKSEARPGHPQRQGGSNATQRQIDQPKSEAMPEPRPKRLPRPAVDEPVDARWRTLSNSEGTPIALPSRLVSTP